MGQTEYSTPIDMWSVGCIMGELLTGIPLLPGESEFEQLDKIVTLLGTPTEQVWPDLKKLPNWGKVVLKRCESSLAVSFSAAFGAKAPLSAAGVDLLGGLLHYSPDRRLTAEEALKHPWFSEAPMPQKEALMPTFRK